MIRILLEGGLGGHMPHLYENGDLTFSEIKNVFKQASKGQLKGTEKTDGQNIKLSFDVKTQKALGARNITQIKSGGLTIEEMINFFADHPNPNLKFAFSDAIKIFEKAVKLLDINKQIEIFGPSANNWYNAEVMDDRTRNVVNYDARNLLIHRTGHTSYDSTTGKAVEKSDIDQKADMFMRFLEKVQNTVSDKRHAILVNPIQNLKALDNKEALRNAFMALDDIMSKYGLSDSSTINDLLKKDLNTRLKTQLPLEVKSLIIDGTLGIIPLKKREVKSQLPKELHGEVDNVIDSLKVLKKEAIKPLEILITDFAAEMLRTLESIFILDNKKETDRLAKEVDVAIKAIQSSGKQGDIDFLNRQLDKLKGADTISSAVEGFAFSYKGVIYKFTGKFAPVNQILGLSKYGRGSKSDNEELNEQQAGTNKFDIALLGGGFKPPHKGHIALIKQLASQADRVIVFTSDKAGKDRNFVSGELKGQPIDGKKCNEFLQRMISAVPELNNVEIKITNKPLTDIYQYVEKESKFGESILIGVGDKEDDAKRFDTLAKYTPPEKKLQVQILPLKPVTFNGEPLSATRLREAISNRNTERVATFIPDEIANKLEFAQDMIDTFFGAKTQSVQEISTMAGGNVSTGPALTMRKKKMIDRNAFMEEMELRKTIREALILRQKKKNAAFKEEQMLRKELRKIIREAKSDFNYGNTGLNKLSDWLQVKIPIIKAKYKKLATDKSQRDAFRARLMQLSAELFDELESKILAGANKNEELEEDINVSLDGPDTDDKILPVVSNFTTKPEKAKTNEKDEFKIEPTGEADASEFFDDYKGELSKVFVSLDNAEDRKLFREYFMSNLPAIMDQAEAEVSNIAKPVNVTPPAGSQAQPQ
jgi:cytidyltransferase-like protein